MAQDQNALIWLDMEMTGLVPEQDRVLEIAMIVTNSELEVIGESEVWVLHQSDEVLAGMDDWNKGTHGRSGLIDKVRVSELTEQMAETQCLEFLKKYVPAGKSPMCGNSICQDRRFLAKWLPNLEAYFHYRNLDVSTIKELCKRWRPEIAKGFEKKSRHQALADIEESIDELKYYRQHFLLCAPQQAG